jgi:uncharacterized membrane protein YraQ (UPF0718 family)
MENRMSTNGRFPAMLIPTIIMGALALALILIAYYRGDGEHILGLKFGGAMLIQVLPLLLLAMIVAGMVQVLIPHELISKWIGAESGIRGLLIGTVMGGITPGGPIVSMPIAAGLLRTGASLGTMVAFVTSWSLIAASRLPLEIGVMGWKFALIRLACTFFFPPIAGLLADRLFSHVNVV